MHFLCLLGHNEKQLSYIYIPLQHEHILCVVGHDGDPNFRISIYLQNWLDVLQKVNTDVKAKLGTSNANGIKLLL